MKVRSHQRGSYRDGSMNVYADLGYRAPESIFLKAQLVSAITEVLADRGMTQRQAATVLRVRQPKLSKMLHGQFRRVSARRLMDCLTQLGQDVRIGV